MRPLLSLLPALLACQAALAGPSQLPAMSGPAQDCTAPPVAQPLTTLPPEYRQGPPPLRLAVLSCPGSRKRPIRRT